MDGKAIFGIGAVDYSEASNTSSEATSSWIDERESLNFPLKNNLFS